MLLRTRLLSLIEERELPRWERMRVMSALSALERDLGPIEVAVLQDVPVLAQKVTVPGDDAVYITIGEWSDGTVDVVREQGSFPKDCLVGWRPGQSLESYKQELRQEPEEPAQHARASRPLSVAAGTQKSHRRRPA